MNKKFHLKPTLNTTLRQIKAIRLKYLVIVFISAYNNVSALCIYDNNISTDTLIIDEAFETPQMYLYHEQHGDTYVFHETWSNKTLKYVSNGSNFSGVLILLRESGTKKICPFSNGIPNGVWIEIDKEGHLKHKVPIKNGFYHGKCIFFYYDKYIKSDSVFPYLIGHFTNGYPDGLFSEYSYYYNTREIYESAKVSLKTIFYNPLKESASYLNRDPNCYNRMAVQGIYISAFNIESFLPSVEPSSDPYWVHQIGCLNLNLNPLQTTQTIIDGEYIKKDIHVNYHYQPSETGEDGAIKTKERTYWSNGKCIWHELYGGFVGSIEMPSYSLIRKSEYEYFTGYYIEHRKSKNYSWVHFNNENIYRSIINMEDLIFMDTVTIEKQMFINGREAIGQVRGFTSDGYNSISAPENKFFVKYNYHEGELFFGRKVGEWNYYLVYNGDKVLVCSTQYKTINISPLTGFKVGNPLKRLCTTIDIPNAIKDGHERFYRLDNREFYVGYLYKNGQAVSILRE